GAPFHHGAGEIGKRRNDPRHPRGHASRLPGRQLLSVRDALADDARHRNGHTERADPRSDQAHRFGRSSRRRGVDHTADRDRTRPRVHPARRPRGAPALPGSVLMASDRSARERRAERSALQNILVMARFDLRFMLRSRETLMWMFFMPVLFMFLIGKAMPGRSSGSSAEATVAVLDQDGGPLAGTFLRHLDQLDYAIVSVDAESTLLRHQRRVRIPAGFSSGALRGEQQAVELGFRNEGTSANLDKVRVQRALFQTLGDLAVVVSEGDSVTDASLAAVSARPRAMEIDSRPAGKRRTTPTGFQQSVPGILVMFVLLVSLTTGGVVLVIEREEGLLRRLASAPVTRRQIVTAKVSSRVLLGFIQTTFAMLIGTLLFGFDWTGQLPAVL